jgi:DNA-binding transcriptional MocR family regulator
LPPALLLGIQRTYLTEVRRSYRGRVEVTQGALETHFGDLATWQRPHGGYFFWLRFDDDIDTASLLDRATSLETGFQPGSAFSSDSGLGNFMRLCFSHYGADDIREGITRLRAVFEESLVWASEDDPGRDCPLTALHL